MERKRVKKMKLLVIGAGGHGKVVAEIAEDCGYKKIAFLDDHNTAAIGKLADIGKFTADYEYAFVGIGNNAVRGELIERLHLAGYKIPVLVHPTAYVSRTAQIGPGTVVEPKAIVNANTVIGDGCILSVGAIIDHDVTVGDGCHINSGAIVKAGAKLAPLTKLEAGQVVLGYEEAVVKAADSNSQFAKEYKKMTGQEPSFF